MHLEEYFTQAMVSFSEHHKFLTESHNAFWNDHNNNAALWKHKAAEINGDIRTDSDCTDADKYFESKVSKPIHFQ